MQARSLRPNGPVSSSSAAAGSRESTAPLTRRAMVKVSGSGMDHLQWDVFASGHACAPSRRSRWLCRLPAGGRRAVAPAGRVQTKSSAGVPAPERRPAGRPEGTGVPDRAQAREERTGLAGAGVALGWGDRRQAGGKPAPPDSGRRRHARPRRRSELRSLLIPEWIGHWLLRRGGPARTNLTRAAQLSSGWQSNHSESMPSTEVVICVQSSSPWPSSIRSRT